MESFFFRRSKYLTEHEGMELIRTCMPNICCLPKKVHRDKITDSIVLVYWRRLKVIKWGRRGMEMMQDKAIKLKTRAGRGRGGRWGEILLTCWSAPCNLTARRDKSRTRASVIMSMGDWRLPCLQVVKSSDFIVIVINDLLSIASVNPIRPSIRVARN